MSEIKKQLKVGTKIRDKTAGDDWTLRRRVPRIPTGQNIVEVWFTVKEKIESSDADAIFQKHITAVAPTDDPGVGQIEDNGSGGTAVIRIDVTKDDSVKLKPWVEYFYDMQVKTSTGKYDTPDDGTIIAHPQITQSV